MQSDFKKKRAQSATTMITTQMKVCIEIVKAENVMELQQIKALRVTFHPPGARAPNAENIKTK